MKYYSWILLCFSIALSSCSGCKTEECGSWAFSGTLGTNHNQPTYSISSAFTFNPANCGKNCSVSQDCIIQMVAVFDSEDNTFKFATGETGAPGRVTSDGWVIDQLDGWAYGYYGLNNDGSFDAGYNPTGGNGVATTLYDVPSWGANTIFYTVDVAVSYQSRTCNNSILGYYFWSWSIDNNGIAHAGANTTAWTGLDTDFQNAVSRWNAWAPGSGSQSEGGSQPTLPHAVLLPTLTNL